MRRVVFLGLSCLVVSAGSATAHFLFLIPPEADQPLRLVWSDTPTPDPNAALEPAAGGRYAAVDGAGKATPVTPKPGGDGWLSFPELPSDAKAVTGTIDYGVVFRGQPEPALVLHHAKVMLAPSAKSEPLPAELTPVTRPGGIAFCLTVGGKKVSAADVLVLVPGEKRPRAVRTDAEGCTPSFDHGGQYAARALTIEAKQGEYRGRKYQQVRHYTTLVVRYETGR